MALSALVAAAREAWEVQPQHEDNEEDSPPHRHRRGVPVDVAIETREAPGDEPYPAGEDDLTHAEPEQAVGFGRWHVLSAGPRGCVREHDAGVVGRQWRWRCGAVGSTGGR